VPPPRPAPAVTEAPVLPPTVARAPDPFPAAAGADLEPLPPPAADLWVRIVKGYRIPDLVDDPLVAKWEQYYSERPDYVARMVDRGRRYLYHIVAEIDERRMPLDLALLPMIESAMNPNALSRARAAGIWQFMPSTGKHYGLEQTFWFDSRRDVVAATESALDYLVKLHGDFNDWQLALAAYNWGEGNVGRAIAKNRAKGKPGDYASLPMPAETRNYLPKLQAVKNIIADPARFGLTLADIPNESYIATITTPRHIDVELAARFAEIPVEEFRFLNPAHNKPVINANAAETIVLPKEKVEVFQRNLANHTEPLVSWHAYTVKPGERIEKIAAKHDITVSELKRVNNLGDRSRITTGQPLLVPVKAGAALNLPDLPAPAMTKARVTKTRYVPKSRRGAVQKAVQRQDAPKHPKGRKTTTASAKAAPSAKKAKVATPAKKAPAGKESVRLAEHR